MIVSYNYEQNFGDLLVFKYLAREYALNLHVEHLNYHQELEKNQNKHLYSSSIMVKSIVI